MGRQYKRVKAPLGLGPVETKVWNMVTASLPPEHFAECDIPILAVYCQTFVHHQRCVTELQEAPRMTLVAANGAVSMHPMINATAKFAGSLGQLAMKLRIIPQARLATKERASNPEFKGEKMTDGDDVDSLFFHA